MVNTRHSALVKSLDSAPHWGREGQRVGFFLLYDMADGFIGNIPVDKVAEMARMNHNVMEEHMLEMIANILVTTALLALGAILFVFVCAMIGWMIYTTQNGGDDD